MSDARHGALGGIAGERDVAGRSERRIVDHRIAVI
jgi:hypothetical protein